MNEQTLRRGWAGGRRGPDGRRGRVAVRPRCEALEARRLLTLQTWISSGADTNWATASNWSAGPINPGDTLLFNGSDTSPTSNNNEATVNPYDLQLDAGGYDLTGTGIDLADAGGTSILADNPGGNNTLDLPLTLTGDATANVTTAGATLTVNGTLSGTSGLTLTTQGAGTLILSGTSNASGLAGTVDDRGILQVDSATGPGAVQIDGGTLQGTGTVGAITTLGNGGTLSPGNAGPGTLTAGSVALDPTTTFAVAIDGASSGMYGQLIASGSVNLDGAPLSIDLGYAPGSTDSYILIQNTSNSPVQGTFKDLPQGGTITVGSTQFVINYDGGPSGNEVVLSVSAPPVANPDLYTLAENNPNFSVPAPGILGNDTNPSGLNTLHPILMTGPVHGTLTLNDDGSFSYVPATGFSGADSFTYEATNGLNTSQPATVSLVVNPVNSPPQAASITYNVVENNPLSVSAPGLLSGSFSPEGLTLTPVLVAGPTHGSLGSGTLPADGSFAYTPAPGYTGTDSFTFLVQDTNGLTSATATVTLNVQDVPSIVVSSSQTLTQNGTLSVAAPGVLTGAVSPARTTLSAVLVNGPADGVVALNADGSFTYTPVANFSGTDSFTFKANDGTLDSNIATVTLHVTPSPLAPTAGDVSYSVQENQPLSIATPGLFLAAQNPSGGNLTAVVANNPIHGTLTTFPGDGSFIYTPDQDFFGTDTFAYYVQSNGLSSNVATATITVSPVAQAPIAHDDTYSSNENVALSVGAPGVLGNDIDPNGFALSAILQAGPMHGALQLNSDGSFTYTPTANYSGPDSFTYVAYDGKLESAPATVSIAVNQVVVPPTSSGSSFTMQEDDQLYVPSPGVLGSATDPQGLPLQAILVNPTIDGTLSLNPDGSFSYTPRAGFVGTDSFTFKAGDGKLESSLSTVTINVTGIPGTTVGLAPGVPDNGGFTNDSSPIFTGTTLPGLQVKLYIETAGGGTDTVGQTQADSSGHYTVASAALADGAYHFWVDAVRSNGLSTGSVDAGTLSITTASPTVTNVFMVPRTGQIMITFQPGPSGMNLASITDPANYSFSRASTPGPRSLIIRSVTLVPPGSSTGPVTVALTSSVGKPIPAGHYLFQILSGGITDNAGNRLEGLFNGGYPTGGSPGTIFSARFISKSQSPNHPIPALRFIPVLTHHGSPRLRLLPAVRHGSSDSRPAGPLGRGLARQHHAPPDLSRKHHHP